MYIKEVIEVLKQHKSTTDKFNHTVGNVKVSEAIDTVLSLINTGNKKGLDENLLEKGIDKPDNQDVLSYKKDRLYTAEDMNDFAEWSYKQSYRQMWNAGKYIGYSGMLELWEQQRKGATE